MDMPGRRSIDGCISFNDEKSVFYSGQVIEGKLKFELDSPLQISAIDIVYLGEATVEWTEEQIETYGGLERTKLLKYVGREEYFNYVQRLTQGPWMAPPGAHSVPFSYQIPFTCPSTFKGDKGKVRCTVTVYIVHEDGVTKDKIGKEIDVIAPMNLNTGSDDIKNPLVMQFEEMMGCQCVCGSRPLGVCVRLPAQGLCPGRTVPVSFSVRNTSSVEITKILFQINRRQRYRSQQPASEYEPPVEEVTTLKRGPVCANTTADYVFPLTVPEFIAPYMDNCGIIDIAYFFKVTIKLSGCNDDMEDEAEICMGLVPLGETAEEALRNHPLADKLPSGPIPEPNNPSSAPPAYQTFAPSQNLAPGASTFDIGFRSADINSIVNLAGSTPGYPYQSLPQGQSPPYPAQSFGLHPTAPPPY